MLDADSAVRALIFDCDGTLADTMPLHWKAWQTISGKHKFTFTEERFYSLGGIPSRHILQTLRAEQSLGFDPLMVAKEKEAAYLALLAEVTPIEKVIGVAMQHAGKLPMAVASGGSRSVIGFTTRSFSQYGGTR